jgi:hypothetical protein
MLFDSVEIAEFHLQAVHSAWGQRIREALESPVLVFRCLARTTVAVR